MKSHVLFAAILIVVLPVFISAEQKSGPLNPFGINDRLIGQLAPELEISKWLNGKGTFLKNLQGKVVVLEFFQLWCPGCSKFSIPLMKEWIKKFADDKNVFFISIHTVFEGHSYQNPRRLKKFLKSKNIKHPVGIDRHRGNEPVPITMQRYRTGGTPCIVIIDKSGVIRFKYFGAFREEPVGDLIRYLIKEKFQSAGEKN